MRAHRALPTMLRVAFVEAVAYRAEMLVWVLATTMPFVNLALWTAVASAGTVRGVQGTWDSGRFVAYFLSAFVIRQMVSAWAAWQINFEARQGVLTTRLLKPIHPVLSYAVENFAYLPLRLVVALPVIVALAMTSASEHLARDPAVWGLCALSVIGGFGIAFFVNVGIGALCFYVESSVKVMDVWLAALFLFSGYTVPIDLFPAWLGDVIDVLPFRYQIGLPVELMTGAHALPKAVALVAQQWLWVSAIAAGALALWSRGVRRFQAYGG